MEFTELPETELRSEKPKSTVSDQFVVVALIGIALATTLFGGYVILNLFVLDSFDGPYDGRERLSFSREGWLAAEKDPKGARYLMLEDLLAKEPIVGCTRSEVESRLGPLLTSTQHPGFGFCYYLGPEPGFVSIDSIWLQIEFDATGHVIATSTATD